MVNLLELSTFQMAKNGMHVAGSPPLLLGEASKRTSSEDLGRKMTLGETLRG